MGCCCGCCKKCCCCLCVFLGRPHPDKEIKVYEKYNAHLSKIIGVFEVIIGYSLVIVSGALQNDSRDSSIGVAYIAGILSMVAGSLGILAGSYKSKRMVIANLVLACIALLFSFISFLTYLAGVATMHIWWDKRHERDYHGKPEYDPGYWQTILMIVIIIVLCLVLIILLIVSIIICAIAIHASASLGKVPPEKSYSLNCRCCVALIFAVIIMILALCSIVIYFTFRQGYCFETERYNGTREELVNSFFKQDIRQHVDYLGASDDEDGWRYRLKYTCKLRIPWAIWGGIWMIIFAACALGNYRISKQTAMIFFLTSCVCCTLTSLMMWIFANVFAVWLGEDVRYRTGRNKEKYKILVVESIICCVATILGILCVAYALYILFGKHKMVRESQNARSSPEEGRKSHNTSAASPEEKSSSPQDGRKSHSTRASTAQDGRKSQNAVSPAPTSGSQQALVDAEPSDPPKTE